MRLLLVVAVIIAPAMFWVAYYRYKDRYRPEPLVSIGVAYLLGIGSGVLALRIGTLTQLVGLPADPAGMAQENPFGFMAYSILVTGPVEELAKFLPFWLVCLRFKAFDDALDGIMYAAVIGLGFASYENIVYLDYKIAEGAQLLGRAVASPLTHSMWASIWGYTCGKARREGRSIVRPALVGLALAILAHGLFNSLTLSAHPLVQPGAALLVLVIWIWRIRLIERIHRHENGV